MKVTDNLTITMKLFCWAQWKKKKVHDNSRITPVLRGKKWKNKIFVTASLRVGTVKLSLLKKAPMSTSVVITKPFSL